MMKIKLLYVEDDPDILEVAAMALALDPEFEVRLVKSGEAAMVLAATDPWRADLMLLDLMMPGLDGAHLLQRLRAVGGYEQTPVVFVTARTGDRDLKRLLESGAKGVITKPFDPMTLAQEVRKFIVKP